MVVLEVFVLDGVSNQPVSGAQVIVQGTYIFTEYTGVSGYALFDGYPVPEVVAISVSKDGYYPHPLHYEDLRNIMVPHSVSFTLIPLSVPEPEPGDPRVTHMVMSVEPSDGLLVKPTIYVKCTYEYVLASGSVSILPLINKRVDFYYVISGVERLLGSAYTNAQGIAQPDTSSLPQPVSGQSIHYIAVYIGDSAYRGCFSERTITYQRGTYEAEVTANPVTFPVPNNVTMKAVIRAVTPSGSVLYPSTGKTVTFKVNGVTVGTAPTNLVGEAEFTANISVIGAHQITVTVATDTWYTGVTSNPFTVTGGDPGTTEKLFSVPVWKNATIRKSYWDATGRLTRYVTGVSLDKLLSASVDLSMAWISGDEVAEIDLYVNGQLVLSDSIGPVYTRTDRPIDKAALRNGDNLVVLILSDAQPYTWGAIEYLVNLTVNLRYEPTTTATEPDTRDEQPFSFATIVAAAAALGTAVLVASGPKKAK